MKVRDRTARHLGAAALLVLLGGCASVPPNAGSNPVDPFERVNRQIFAFNNGFDVIIAKPAAKGYNAVVPKPMRECIANFFDNLFEITNIVNAALQGKGRSAGTSIGRFLMNSTVGMAGCIDVASRAGFERDKQFFALTMGTWGIPSGPYIVLPIIGPSSVRDALGEVPDYFTDPISYIHPVKDYYFVYAGRFVVRRSQILDATNLIEQAALDPYQFVRDAYLQRIRSKIMGDGAPPPPVEEDPDSPAPASPESGVPAPGAPVPSAAPSPPREPAAGEAAH